MPYHTVHIAKLSPTQVSKILNSHPVRIKSGSAHSIGLSSEQAKKFKKAQGLGKALTITFDPFQISNHQGLRGKLRGKGTGTILGRTLGGVAGGAAEDAGVRLESVIAGTDSKANQDQYQENDAPTTGLCVNRLHKARRWLGFTQKELGAQKVQDALMDKAASTISYGGNVGRLNKARRWTDYVQTDLGFQPVQDALMGRTAAGVSYGFGLKKRVAKKPKKKMSGRALYNAGYGEPGY